MQPNINENLIKGTSVIGLKIITLNKGEKIEDIDDIIFDPTSNKVLGFLASGATFFSDAKVLHIENAKSIGKDAVIVEDANVLKKVSDLNETISSIARGNNFLTKTKVVTEGGTELGEVSDIYFSFPSGNVEELEVSQGNIKNLQSGKKRVKTSDITTVGKDALIVKTYTEEIFEEQGSAQGLKGVVGNVKETANEALAQGRESVNSSKVDEIKNRVAETAQDLKNKAVDLKGTVTEKIESSKEKAKVEIKQNAVGKYVTKNILTPSDTPFAVRGDLITNELLTKAENEGLLDQVLGNISNEPIEQDKM
jgi:uncharacterized protein YrrD